MLIGLDQVLLRGASSGIPNYARGLLSAIADVEADWKYATFSMKGWSGPQSFSMLADPDRSGSNGIAQSGQLRSQLSALALGVPMVARSRTTLRALRMRFARTPKLDLFYALNFVPAGNIPVPVLPVVHDLIHLSHPELVHSARRRYLSRLPKICEQALRVQAVSRSTADQLEQLLNISRSKIDVVPPVLNPRFLDRPNLGCLHSLGLTQGYFLAVGIGERRKNLKLLIDVAASDPGLITVEHPLVLTGSPAWENLSNQDLYDQMCRQGRIRHLGLVSDSILHGLYAGSTGVLMPSIDEGFGMPVIEAQACGARLVLSDIPALREASGSHASFARYDDVENWGRSMAAVRETSSDPKILDDARRHAATYSRSRAAYSAIASLRHYC